MALPLFTPLQLMDVTSESLTPSEGSIYAYSQGGLLTVADSAGNVVQIHHGGHGIQTPTGTLLPDKPTLKFLGANVFDDSENNCSVVEIAHNDPHVIINSEGNVMPQRPNLKFIGLETTDDHSMESTVVTVTTTAGHEVKSLDGETLPQRKNLTLSGTAIDSICDNEENDATDIIINAPQLQRITIPFSASQFSGGAHTINQEDISFPIDSPMLQIFDSSGNYVECGIKVTNNADITIISEPFSGFIIIAGATPIVAIKNPEPVPIQKVQVLDNASFTLNSNGTFLPFQDSILIPISDGWAAYQAITGTGSAASIGSIAVNGAPPINAICVTRPRNNDSLSNICIYRPLTPVETFPLRGKTAAFSLDLMARSGFPTGEENGIVVSVTGTTNTVEMTKINSGGEFVTDNILIHTFDSIANIPVNQYARYSLTFYVPFEMTQICLRMIHTPYQTDIGIPFNYEYRLCRPALGIGTEEQPYQVVPENITRIAMASHYQRIFATYTGPVTSGDVITQRFKFPFPFDDVPQCIHCENESPSKTFISSEVTDVSSITAYDCTITRIASATSSTGSFRTFYDFACPLW